MFPVINNTNSNKQPQSTGENLKSRYVVYALIIIAIIAIGCSSFFIFTRYQEKKRNDSYKESVASSTQNNDPESLKALIKEDLQNGINDEYTRSLMYYLSHRYFDNGGNIYEIYDFVNETSEVSFLKEAEGVFPRSFEKIKNKELPITKNTHGMLALLAYLEVMHKHGYADIASTATAAHEYILLAREAARKVKEFELKENRTDEENAELTKQKDWFRGYSERSLYFFDVSREILTSKNLLNIDVVQGITHNDRVIGFNHTAATMRYYKTLDVRYFSSFSAEQLFELSELYARKHITTVLFIGLYMNASTLVSVGEGNDARISQILNPILSRAKSQIKADSIPDKILRAKIYAVRSGYFSVNNVVNIAKNSSTFKEWLLKKWRRLD